ncbi:DNA ligase (NAD(+)) LigA [Helicobacter didelphidarum]|uniref:DNA ligase n=1 Tax=Helicobacter didelphidarum TaxID=2040648 RepID=A0A3D8IFY3_9HELI|nr:NAD-dependent DNA ligase LigA [Helicobacter didelphidarum]RDU64038.1 DNA ligase (NAD(+)) LigA [Helicobacter didelphidarum]
MSNILDNSQYQSAVQQLNLYAKHYYELDDPIASDEEYDNLYKKIYEYERNNPNNINPNSPTQRVGGKVLQDFSKNSHRKRMWSLEDVFDNNDLLQWFEKLENALSRLQKSQSLFDDNTIQYKSILEDSLLAKLHFCISPKYDGMSLNLFYKNGKLQSATTRGDGEIGELVTQNAKTIKSIPQTIPFHGGIEIRGEVVLSKKNFDTLNKEREKNNQSLFANPRNAAAGSMRQLDSNLTAERKLDFIAWGIGYCDDMQQLCKLAQKNKVGFYDILMLLPEFGFESFVYLESMIPKNIEKEYQKVLNMREDFEFLLDGFVIVLDDLELQEKLGFTQKAPRYACAYKFPSTEIVIQIDSISPQVGRTGIITPVANFKPTLLDGAYISRATLHNYKEIERKDIRIHDSCLLVRSGDVIPKITKVLTDRRNGNEIEILKPTQCPICHHSVSYEDIFIYCSNPNCDAIIKTKLIHFASKKCMNIEGLGKSIVELLVDLKLIIQFKDIYYLHYENLFQLEGFKEKKAQNLIDSIQGTINNRELWRFIHALGILHIGEVASKKLAYYGIEIFDKSFEELKEINGFGEEMAQSFYDFCHRNKEFIIDLIQIIQPVIEISRSNKEQQENLFAKKTCVITGTFEKSREELKAILESYGAKVTSSVSVKTDYLIVGEKAGSKLQKAQELGLKVIAEKELKDLLGI